MNTNEEHENDPEITLISDKEKRIDKVLIGDPKTGINESLRESLDDSSRFSSRFSSSPRPPSSPRQKQYHRSMPIIAAPRICAQALEMKEKALRFEPIPNLSNDVYEQIIYSLSEDRKNFVIQHKFKDGARINRAQMFTREYQIKAQKQDVKKKAEDELLSQETELHQQFDEFDKKTKQLETELLKSFDYKREDLKSYHNAQLVKHEEKWKSEKKLKEFNHPSSELTDYRVQLASLLVQGRFEEAEKIESVINEQKQIEEVRKFQTMREKFLESEKKVIEKQEQEKQFLEASLSVQLEKFYQQRAKLRLVLENKEKKVNTFRKSVKDADKLWNRERVRRALENTPNSKERSAIAPSNRVRRQDIMDKEFNSLSLPPLKSSRRTTPKKKEEFE